MPFSNFQPFDIHVHSDAVPEGVSIHGVMGGQGPPLLLLHGFPQTHYIWHKIADKLSQKYTVIATDLRGYGASSKPKGSESHIEYSKREMAADQVYVMRKLGFESFFLVSHDRGARVAHRLVLDHPGMVKKLMVLDICPTLYMFDKTDQTFATAYWHWFFMLLPSPHPEMIISSNPQAFWAACLSKTPNSDNYMTESATKEYQDAYFQYDAIHAGCEDYRAAASIDLEHDRLSLSLNEKLQIPVKVFWGSKGIISSYGDPLDVWRGFCGDGVEVTGGQVVGGHYIPEEGAELLREEIEGFMV